MQNNIEISPKEFAKHYQLTGNAAGRSLCFWGHWFGIPGKNEHTIISVDFDIAQNVLNIRFAEKEELTVTNPGSIQEFPDRILINDADKVHWKWYDAGKEKSPKHLHSLMFSKNGRKVSGTSSVHWSAVNADELSDRKPAVLMITKR